MAITVPSGAEIAVERFPASGDRLLWLPSEHGLRGASERALAQGLARLGMEVWLADLHGSYFIPPGRSSLLEVPVEDVAALVEAAQPGAGRRLFVVSAGRGAALALMGLRRWQVDHTQREPLGGVILLNANLLVRTPEPGRPSEYLPIARLSNLPIYLIQPEDSAKRWYLTGLTQALAKGGSEVFAQLVPGVSDGYHVSEDATEEELRQRAALPALMVRAAGVLASLGGRVRTPVVAEYEGSEAWQAQTRAPGLYPYAGDPEAPPLSLRDLTGRRHALAELAGRVVLVNFWTTWCPPCVKEIPSLGRLQARLAGRGLVVLGVDVGEEAARVRAFLDEVPARFPVLLDPDGETVGPWRIRAFPTSFLVDRQGRIRYAYFGALEWDAPEIVETVASLL